MLKLKGVKLLKETFVLITHCECQMLKLKGFKLVKKIFVLVLHIVSVAVGTPGPAAKVHGTLEEELAVGGREEVGAEDDKGVSPHHEGMLHAPPLVIVQSTLERGREGERGGGGGGGTE